MKNSTKAVQKRTTLRASLFGGVLFCFGFSDKAEQKRQGARAAARLMSERARLQGTSKGGGGCGGR